MKKKLRVPPGNKALFPGGGGIGGYPQNSHEDRLVDSRGRNLVKGIHIELPSI